MWLLNKQVYMGFIKNQLKIMTKTLNRCLSFGADSSSYVLILHTSANCGHFY